MPKNEETAEKKETAETKSPKFTSMKAGNGWIIGLLAVIAGVVIFAAGAAVATHDHNGPDTAKGFMVTGGRVGAIGGGGMMGERHMIFDGNGPLSDSQDHARGVVTAVNGSSFTLAGNGSTTNVTTDSSTQYHGGNTVKVNDTVIAVGTTTNGTLKATEIVINP